MMKRRTAIKSIFVFSLGATTLYSCKDKYKAIMDLNLTKINPNPSMIDTVEALSQCIAPLGEIEGLRDHITTPYILMSVNDRSKKAELALFKEGTEAINAYSQDKLGSPFSSLTAEQQSEVVVKLNTGQKGFGKAMLHLFDKTKSYTLEYLNNTEYVQRKAKYYQMSPGKYHGCVAISDLQNPNTI